MMVLLKETRAQSEILKPNRCLEKAAEFWRERRSSPESRACHNGECLRDLTILKKACGLFEIRQAFFIDFAGSDLFDGSEKNNAIAATADDAAKRNSLSAGFWLSCRFSRHRVCTLGGKHDRVVC